MLWKVEPWIRQCCFSSTITSSQRIKITYIKNQCAIPLIKYIYIYLNNHLQKRVYTNYVNILKYIRTCTSLMSAKKLNEDKNKNDFQRYNKKAEGMCQEEANTWKRKTTRKHSSPVPRGRLEQAAIYPTTKTREREGPRDFWSLTHTSENRNLILQGDFHAQKYMQSNLI